MLYPKHKIFPLHPILPIAHPIALLDDAYVYIVFSSNKVSFLNNLKSVPLSFDFSLNL